MKTSTLLCIVLAIAGLALMAGGINIGLGGIRSLGWQVNNNFLEVIDTAAFDAQDNHVRFVGGVLMGVGASLLVGSFRLEQMRTVLIAITIFVFIGGLCRLSALNADVILSSHVAPSMFAELILFPLLGIWIHLAAK